MKYDLKEFFTQCRKITLFCLLLLITSGCEDGGGSGSADIGDNNPDTYLCMGDSITRGDHLISSQSYPSKLADISGKTVINSGRDGEFSWEGRARLQRELERHKPAYCLIMYGANDIIYGLSAMTIPELKTMIDICRSNKTIPVVATLTPTTGRKSYMSGTIDSLNEGIMDIRARRADVNAAFGGDVSLLLADGLHPNSDGTTRIAWAFYDAID